MKLLITLVLIVASASAEVWEFGENKEESVLVAHHQGHITMFEKTKIVTLEVPDCYVVDYVKIEVKNIISNPTVYYNKWTRNVTISYKPLQLSISSYDISAKALKIPCDITRYPPMPQLESTTIS